VKKLLLSSLAGLILTTGSALAADLSMPVKAPYAPPPPAVSWTGCYIDAGVGYGMFNQDHYGETLPGGVPLTATDTSGGRGWLGRVGGGCDYQFGLGGLGNFVVGAFGDYDFMNLTSNFDDLSGIGGNATESGAWYAGGRLGYLVTPSLLTYVDGGYTQTHFDAVSLFGTPFVPPFATGAVLPARTYNGWFLGGGVEYALNMQWIPISGLFWRTEYRFAQYQAADLPINCTSVALCGVVGPTGAGEHTQNEVQTITSGLVWRFNFGGPVATRY
jgi:outer membrane immunogenic protein